MHYIARFHHGTLKTPDRKGNIAHFTQSVQSVLGAKVMAISGLVASGLSTTRRVMLHARVADGLENLYGTDVKPRPSLRDSKILGVPLHHAANRV